MTYTIISAAYANQEHTAAVLQTEEAGAVLISDRDTPDLWQQMLAWALTVEGGSEPVPTAYTPANPFPALKPALQADLTARRDRLMFVCVGLKAEFDLAGDTEASDLTVRLLQRLKAVSPKRTELGSATTAAQYAQLAEGLAVQALQLALDDTWPRANPDDPLHPVPDLVKLEFARYMGKK